MRKQNLAEKEGSGRLLPAALRLLKNVTSMQGGEILAWEESPRQSFAARRRQNRVKICFF